MSEANNEQTAQTTNSADVLYNEQKPVETPQETPPAETPPAESATPNSETPPAEKETPAADDKTKTAENKEADKIDQTKDKPSVPEKYDLKLPDQSPVNPVRLEKIAAEAKAQGLSQDQAQELVTREHNTVSDLVQAHHARVKEWSDASAADKEVGGPDINRNIALADRLVDTYGSPELKEQLKITGFGSHPEMLRLFVRIAKAGGEDRLVRGGGTPPAPKKSAADLLFGEGTESQT